MATAYGTVIACNYNTAWACAYACGISVLGPSSPLLLFWGGSSKSPIMFDLSGYKVIIEYRDDTSGEDYSADY